jgi:hypothetical protein
MKRRIITLSILFIFSIGIANAQRGENYHKDRWEKFRSEKIAFITSRLELTPAEAEKFWPVYNQMDKERWEVQKLRREMEEKVRNAGDALTEKEIIKLTREYAESMQKEGAIPVKYNEEFLKILPPKKVLNLYKTEKEFRIHMIKMFRDHGKKENSKHK